MTFDEWYEKNKEILTALTFRSALKRVWIEAKVNHKKASAEVFFAKTRRCFGCGQPPHELDCR